MKTIKSSIAKWLNLRPEDENKFFWLFAHSFFLGFLISFHFVPANAMFIKHYSSVYLPLAYIAAGLMGYLTTFLYSKIQKKVASDKLFISALIFLIFITLVQRVGIFWVSEKFWSFFVFIWAPPIFTLISLENGGLSLRFLDLRQTKRLFGYINMGGMLASILSYILIPLIIKKVGHPYNLLYFGTAGICVALILLLIILKRFPEEKTQNSDSAAEKKQDLSFKELVKDKYFRLILGCAALATMVIYFNDFGYLASVKSQKEFLPNQEAVSRFISIICAIFKTGELVFSFFSNRILGRYGMLFGLTALPVTGSALIGAAAVCGIIFGAESQIFFVFMVLNKILDRILRMSVNEISFNVLYQPLQNKQKLGLQAKVGIVIQVASGLTGLILWGVGGLLTHNGVFHLKYYTLFYFPILVTWAFFTRKLFLNYRETLRQILVEISKDTKKDIYKSSYGCEILTKKFRMFNPAVVNLSVTILSEVNPNTLEPYSPKLLETQQSEIVKAVAKNIDPMWRDWTKETLKELVETSNNEEVKKLSQQALQNLDFSEIPETLPEGKIYKLINSNSVDDKLFLIKFLWNYDVPNEDELVDMLLKNEHFLVKKATIQLISKNRSPHLISELVKLLQSNRYHYTAANTLLEIGEKVLPELDEYFKKPDTSKKVLLRVIEIFAKTGSSTAQSYLVSHLDYPNSEVQLAVIWALSFCRYQAKNDEFEIVHKKLEEVIENISWLYATISDIENEKNTLKLYQALDEERERDYELVFKLLSFLYEPRIINLIKKNIIGKNTIFALEIIDNFILQDIKQPLIPIFDDISTSQRLKKLQEFFPQRKLSFTDRLKEIIKRDYNRVDVWSVSKAVDLLGKLHRMEHTKAKKSPVLKELEMWNKNSVDELLANIRKSEMPDEIFACLYHPEELIYSSAAKIIFDENPSRCEDYLSKLSQKRQHLLHILPREDADVKYLLTGRVRLLKQHPLFFNIPENLLVKLAELFVVKNVSKNEKVSFEYKERRDDIFIVQKGALVYHKGESDEAYFFSNDIIVKGLNINEFADFMIAKKETILLIGNRYEYFNKLISETEILQVIFDSLQPSKKDE